MLLTFSTNLAKLLDQTKIRTTRANVPYYQAKWQHGIRNLDMWFGNPRHIHLKNHLVYKMGIAKWATMGIFHINKNQYCFSDGIIMVHTDFRSRAQEIAKQDGFPSLDEYLQALARIKSLTLDQVKAREWATLTWKWHKPPIGPSPPWSFNSKSTLTFGSNANYNLNLPEGPSNAQAKKNTNQGI